MNEMLHLRATRFHLFRSCAIQMFSVATCFLCRIDNCDPCVVCFAFVRFKWRGCATCLLILTSGVGILPGMVEWWHGWIGGGSRTARPRSRTRVRGQQGQDPGCGVA